MLQAWQSELQQLGLVRSSRKTAACATSTHITAQRTIGGKLILLPIALNPTDHRRLSCSLPISSCLKLHSSLTKVTRLHAYHPVHGINQTTEV